MDRRGLFVRERISGHHGSSIAELFPVNPWGRGGSWPPSVYSVHVDQTRQILNSEESRGISWSANRTCWNAHCFTRITDAVVSLNFTLIRRLYTCQFSTLWRSVIDSERRGSQLVRIPVSPEGWWSQSALRSVTDHKEYSLTNRAVWPTLSPYLHNSGTPLYFIAFLHQMTSICKTELIRSAGRSKYTEIYFL